MLQLGSGKPMIEQCPGLPKTYDCLPWQMGFWGSIRGPLSLRPASISAIAITTTKPGRLSFTQRFLCPKQPTGIDCPLLF